jgi:radical SAM protein (TIGR01212 family)
VRGCYYSFNDYLRERFGARVHRLSLNAGFGCPNRDGNLSRDGCIFCNEKGFAHFTENTPPLHEQIKSSRDFFRRRFKAEKFIAYFQNAANTYRDTRGLKEAYDVVRNFPDIVGLFISTRPDCIDAEKLDLIESYAEDYEVWIEYGLQSIHERTLKKINRSHTFAQSLKAIEATARRNIKVGAHVILGFPGESKDDMMKTAEAIAGLPVSGVKLHVLHVLSDTKLQTMFERGEIKLLERSEYVSLACDFLERLNPGCVILRLVSDARKEALVAPEWINEKQKVIKEIEDEFQGRATKQGSKYYVYI